MRNPSDFISMTQLSSAGCKPRLRCLIWRLALLLLAGCEQTALTDPAAHEQPSPSPLTVDTEQQEPALRQTWDVFYLNDTKAGYVHIKTVPFTEDHRPLVRISSESEISIKRFGQTTVQRLSFNSVETPDGRLVRFQSKVASGKAVIVTTGSLAGGRLNLETSSQGKITRSSLEWDASWDGFFAVEQSLRRQPMKPGEQRTIKSLMPLIHQPGNTILEAIDYETTRLLSEARELLKIKSTMEVAGTTVETILWADADGETLKTFQATFNQASYRTTEEVALQPSEGSDFDLGLTSVVKIERPVRDLHTSSRVLYRAILLGGDPTTVFASGATQTVSAIDRQTAKILVRRITPTQPAELDAAEEPPTDDDLDSNNLIQSDDRLVVDMAASVAPGENDAWKISLALERFVDETIQEKNFSVSLATAADVARSPEGDCTEHAVLLAALCRARKIPARVALGLVYFPQQEGFAYHMWTEVWIRDRWIPLDATRGDGGIGAGHLKLAHSHLKGASAYTVFLPVIQVIGQLQIEIVEAR